jgi:diguanylate cyclase (GGDEF)-like protein
MAAAPIPENEPARLESLRRMLAAGAPDGEAFDRVTRAALHLLDTPIALISLVDQDRQWFKSCIGLTVHETPREISFCAHAILQDEPFVVEDALADPRFADNPLVLRAPKIRFYAGRPLRNAEGFAVGALCVIDRKPRRLSGEQREMLDHLGHWAEALFAIGQLRQSQRSLTAALEDAQRSRMVDPALHIWNRAAIVDILERETRRALRHHQGLSVLLVEVEAGAPGPPRETHEAAVEEVAQAMRAGLRPYDAVGRFDTGELLVVLPDSARGAAAAVTRRLNECIDHTRFAAHRGRSPCRVRTGAAWLAPHAQSGCAEALVACADQALLRARQTGGNLVEADSSAWQADRGAEWIALPADEDELPASPLYAAKLHRLRAWAQED